LQFDELLREFRIPLFFDPEDLVHNNEAPTHHAVFGFDRETKTWGVMVINTSAIEETLHEACHLLCGPESLRSEGDLMVFQWALIQLLDPEPYRICREAFATYTWDWSIGLSTDVGRDDTRLFADQEWLSIHEKLIAQGWLDAEGKPLLRGIHPDWEPKDVGRTWLEYDPYDFRDPSPSRTG